MVFNITYKKDKDLICIHIEGKVELSMFSKMADAVADTLREHPSCSRLINDMRDAQLPDSPVDIYNMPKCAKSSGVLSSLKRAIIVNESQKFRFLETVFINQGSIVKLFNSFEEAEKWLFVDKLKK